MTKPAESSPHNALILEVAARLFREKGYDATTVRDIAGAAGILPGTLHYWFPNKELILVEMTERALVKISESVRKAIEKSEHPAERLKLALETYITEVLSGGDAMVVLLYEFGSLRGKYRAPIATLRDRFDRMWDGLLHQAAGAGHIRPDLDVRMIRLFSLGAVNWMRQWYSPEGGYSVEQIVEMYCGFFARGAFTDARCG